MTNWLILEDTAKYLKMGKSTRCDLARKMYGVALRLMECLRLRAQDIGFARSEIMIRDGKGAKERITMPPESFKGRLKEHLKRVWVIHKRALADGWGASCCRTLSTTSIPTPEGLAPAMGFPQENRWKNARSGNHPGCCAPKVL